MFEGLCAKAKTAFHEEGGAKVSLTAMNAGGLSQAGVVSEREAAAGTVCDTLLEENEDRIIEIVQSWSDSDSDSDGGGGGGGDVEKRQEEDDVRRGDESSVQNQLCSVHLKCPPPTKKKKTKKVKKKKKVKKSTAAGGTAPSDEL